MDPCERKALPLYFLHIPKVAGTSVTKWLSRKIGESRMCPAKNWDQLVAVGNTNLSSYALFCGHYGWGLDTFLNHPVDSITVLRDPVERTWSHYRHVHRDPEHPRHVVVSKQSFRDFLFDRENWAMIENFQARYLVRSPIAFRDYVTRLDANSAKRNRLATASEETRYLLDTSYVRSCAYENLDRLKVIGVTKLLPRFITDVASTFSLAFNKDDDVLTSENVAPPWPEQFSFDTSMLQIIHDLTHLDQELFDRVLMRLQQ